MEVIIKYRVAEHVDAAEIFIDSYEFEELSFSQIIEQIGAIMNSRGDVINCGNVGFTDPGSSKTWGGHNLQGSTHYGFGLSNSSLSEIKIKWSAVRIGLLQDLIEKI